MNKIRFSYTVKTLVVLAAGSCPVACGGESGQASLPLGSGGDPSEELPGPGEPPMSAGGTSTGGTSGSGGTTATLDYPGSTIELCPGAPLVSLPVESFAPCNVVGCQAAHCVPESAIPADVPKELLGRCEDPTTLCVPDDYTATFGKFLAKSCESILGAEGRCISTCIPQVNGLMDALPQDNCGDNERCAPCVNPNDGTETGACSQGCDPGQSATTSSNPALFPSCAGGEGACVPRDIIPQALLGQLIQETCPSPEQVCSPLEKSQNLKYNFPECTPSDPFVGVLAAPGPNGQLGGCVPAWLADANLIEGIFLHQDTCAPGKKCAPCHNPLRFNEPTGACPVPLPSDPSGGMPPDGSGTGTDL